MPEPRAVALRSSLQRVVAFDGMRDVSQVQYGGAAFVGQHASSARSRVGRQYLVSTLTTAAEVAALSSRCDALLVRPLEQNAFYEPWMLAAALRILPARGVYIVVISEVSSGNVTGIFPFRRSERLFGVQVLASWRHSYCFLCTPLLAASQARQTLRCLFDWLESKQAPANVIELDLYAGDGPFDALLKTELKERLAQSLTLS